jgi:hypothetical protein
MGIFACYCILTHFGRNSWLKWRVDEVLKSPNHPLARIKRISLITFDKLNSLSPRQKGDLVI